MSPDYLLPMPPVHTGGGFVTRILSNPRNPVSKPPLPPSMHLKNRFSPFIIPQIVLICPSPQIRAQGAIRRRQVLTFDKLLGDQELSGVKPDPPRRRRTAQRSVPTFYLGCDVFDDVAVDDGKAKVSALEWEGGLKGD